MAEEDNPGHPSVGVIKRFYRPYKLNINQGNHETISHTEPPIAFLQFRVTFQIDEWILDNPQDLQYIHKKVLEYLRNRLSHLSEPVESFHILILAGDGSKSYWLFPEDIIAALWDIDGIQINTSLRLEVLLYRTPLRKPQETEVEEKKEKTKVNALFWSPPTETQQKI